MRLQLQTIIPGILLAAVPQAAEPAPQTEMPDTTDMVRIDAPARHGSLPPGRATYLPAPFFMDRHEVTQASYRRTMGKSPAINRSCDSCPVENITWYEARAYCHRLGKQLPTAAQWEYACGAGQPFAFFWGDNEEQARDYAWYAATTSGTMPVGRKKSNLFGICDMSGNVAEWCRDTVMAAIGNGETDFFRAVRGGGWRHPVRALKCSAPDRSLPLSRHSYIGFRCVYPITGPASGRPPAHDLQ